MFGSEPCGLGARKAHCWGKRHRLDLAVNEERVIGLGSWCVQ